MLFLDPVNGAVITGFDGNGFVADVDTIQFEAFDAADNLLTSGTSSAETIAFSAIGIRHIVLAAPETGFVFGPITIETAFQSTVMSVPTPAALPLMLAGVGVFGFVGRRRRHTG